MAITVEAPVLSYIGNPLAADPKSWAGRIRAYSQVVNKLTKDASERACMFYFFTSSQDGNFRPACRTMCEYLNLSERAYRSVLERLEQKKMIVREPRKAIYINYDYLNEQLKPVAASPAVPETFVVAKPQQERERSVSDLVSKEGYYLDRQLYSAGALRIALGDAGLLKDGYFTEDGKNFVDPTRKYIYSINTNKGD